MKRPSPWLLLVDVERVRSLKTSFAFHAEETDAVPEGLRAYDTAAYLYATSRRHGLTTEPLDPLNRRKYRHYGGASWRARRGAGRLMSRRSAEDVVHARLNRIRGHRAVPSALALQTPTHAAEELGSLRSS